jgi:hypothetical protein
VSHTFWVILGGLALLACVYGGAAVMGRSLRGTLPLFAGIWAIAASINLWVGVMHAGYTLAEELPIFVVVFAVPVLIGWAIARWRR